MKQLSAVLIVLFLASPAAYAQQAEQEPEALVRQVTQEIVGLIKKNRDVYSKDLSKLYAMVDEKVLPHFDFTRMSQWVLGRNWRDATEEQRQRFIKEFRDLLVRTYATALLNYTDQEIAYLPSQKRGENEVVVRTEIKQGGGGPNVPIQYTFYKGKQGWKVYDVVIEGVSLVANYRSVYANKIKSQGLDAVIESMAKENKQKAQGGGAKPGPKPAPGKP